MDQAIHNASFTVGVYDFADTAVTNAQILV